MTMFGSQWLANPSSGVVVENSALFNQVNDEQLTLTPSAGNRRTWTLSGWFNFTLLAGRILSAGPDGNNFTDIQHDGDGHIRFAHFDSGSGNVSLITNDFLRDYSSFGLLVVTVDTTQATASNRVKISWNGQLVTYSTSTYPSENQELDVNANVEHHIGSHPNDTSTFDGYMSEVMLQVGVAGDYTTVSNAGETIASELTPKSNSAMIALADAADGGSFYLDNATNPQTDASGHDNDFSNVNTVTLSSHTPTNRFPMLNPLDAATFTLNNGNLGFDGTSSADWLTARATMAIPSTGKWYWECIATTSGNAGDPHFGIVADSVNTQYANWYQDALAYYYTTRNDTVVNNDYVGTSRGTYTGGNILQIAYDADTGKLHFGIQNSWINGGDPADGSDPDFTTSTTPTFLPFAAIYNNKTGSINFGQSAFAYTPPTDFLALNTDNIPDPAIADPSDYFTPYIYTGDDSGTSRVFTGVGFAPNLVWTKARSSAFAHSFFDTVRGTGKYIASSYAGAEVTNPSSGYITAFGSDGYTFSDGSSNRNNYNADSTYVSWNWVEGATPGFDIVSYTGNATARTIAHNLGVVPEMMIVKNRADTDNWAVYHASNTAAPATDYLVLNANSATADDATVWNDTAPTSSVFSVGTGSLTNGNTEAMIAYVFAPVEGFSAFGPYVGNGTVNGPMVNVGFRPAFIMIKAASVAGSWLLFDTKRDTYNAAFHLIYGQLDDAEDERHAYLDILSNGFKIRKQAEFAINDNAATYVYMAFAESPFKTANAR